MLGQLSVPVLDDEEGSAVEGGGVAEDQEFLGVGGDVEDAKTRGEGVDLEEGSGFAEGEFLAFFLDGDGGDGTVEWGIVEEFLAVVAPDGIEAAGSGDLVFAAAVREMDDGDFAVTGEAGFVGDPVAIG